VKKIPAAQAAVLAIGVCVCVLIAHPAADILGTIFFFGLVGVIALAIKEGKF